MPSIVGRARSMIGGVIIIIGILLCIPSIMGFIAADRIYGDPIYTQEYNLGTTAGVSTPISINDECVVGKNYDIKIKIQASSASPNSIYGQFDVIMNLTSSGSDISDIVNKEWSSTTLNGTYYSTLTKEYKENFAEENDLDFDFKVTQSTHMQSIKVTIEIYENPNRTLYNIISDLSMIFLIPGVIVLLVGCCIAGNKKQN